MIKAIEFKDKEFANKEDLFKALKESEKILIDSKKSEIYKSVEKGSSISLKPLSIDRLIDVEKSVKYDDSYWYLVMNTTNILDSHRDLHISGLWNKSIKDRQYKNYLVDTHDLSVRSTIAKKEYVELLIINTYFKSLGLNYEGKTQALVYKVPKNKIIDVKAKEWLESGDDIQGSVRMQYVDIALAMDSENEQDKENKALYDTYYDIIANKSDFNEEICYFWVVKQAKNIYESSLVPFGSNAITGNIINTKKIEEEFEPLQDTQNDNEDSRSNDTIKPEEIKSFILQQLKN
jgi:hypothetical protein